MKLEKAGIWFLFHLFTIGSIVSKISTQLKNTHYPHGRWVGKLATRINGPLIFL